MTEEPAKTRNYKSCQTYHQARPRIPRRGDKTVIEINAQISSVFSSKTYKQSVPWTPFRINPQNVKSEGWKNSRKDDYLTLPVTKRDPYPT
jgi:hypothetical protein